MILAFLATLASAADLDAFLDAAIENNPDIAVADAQQDQARAGVTVARSALLPSITASGQYQRNQREVIATLPDGTGGTRSLTITPKDQIDVTFRATVPLLAGPALASTTAAAARRDASEASFALSRDQILVQVVQAYWDARVAKQAEEAAAASLQAAAKTLEIARVRTEVSAGSVLDLRRAEADHARAQQTAIQAAQTRADAERALKSLTGLDAAPDQAAPRPMPQGDPVELAMSRNPGVLAARESERSARASRAAAVWAYAPNIAAFAQERVTNATGFTGGAANWQAGVTFSWALLDGFGREGRIAQAAAAEREAEARLRDTEQTIRDQVLSAADGVKTAEATYEAAKAGAAAAEVAQTIAETRYQAGELDTAQLAIARRDALDAKVNLARAEAARALAVERLRLAVGQPVR